MQQFPNLEQYSDEEIIILIALAEAILSALKQSSTLLRDTKRTGDKTPPVPLMEGSIMAVSKDESTGKWQAQVWFTDWKGNRKRKHKRGFSSKREAQAWERSFLGEVHGEAVTIGALLEAFKKDMDTKQTLGNLKESTVYQKRKDIRLYIEPYFANVDAAKVTTQHINNWLTTLLPKCHQGERMGSGTLNILRGLFSQVFEFGIRNYGLLHNPVKNAEMMKPYSNDKRAKLWSLDDYHKFYGSLKQEQYKVIFNILFWSGIRIGELMALTPNDIADDKIYINKGNMHIGSATKISTPKNSQSNREVAIPHKVFLQVTEYISRQEGLSPTDRIFTKKEASIRSCLTRGAEALGLPIVSPHTMRHSYASHSLALSNDAAAVAYQLGHKTPQTTLTTYSHMVPGANEEQAKKLDNLVEI